MGISDALGAAKHAWITEIEKLTIDKKSNNDTLNLTSTNYPKNIAALGFNKEYSEDYPSIQAKEIHEIIESLKTKIKGTNCAIDAQDLSNFLENSSITSILSDLSNYVANPSFNKKFTYNNLIDRKSIDIEKSNAYLAAFLLHVLTVIDKSNKQTELQRLPDKEKLTYYLYSIKKHLQFGEIISNLESAKFTSNDTFKFVSNEYNLAKSEINSSLISNKSMIDKIIAIIKPIVEKGKRSIDQNTEEFVELMKLPAQLENFKRIPASFDSNYFNKALESIDRIISSGALDLHQTIQTLSQLSFNANKEIINFKNDLKNAKATSDINNLTTKYKTMFDTAVTNQNNALMLQYGEFLSILDAKKQQLERQESNATFTDILDNATLQDIDDTIKSHQKELRTLENSQANKDDINLKKTYIKQLKERKIELKKERKEKYDNSLLGKTGNTISYWFTGKDNSDSVDPSATPGGTYGRAKQQESVPIVKAGKGLASFGQSVAEGGLDSMVRKAEFDQTKKEVYLKLKEKEKDRYARMSTSEKRARDKKLNQMAQLITIKKMGGPRVLAEVTKGKIADRVLMGLLGGIDNIGKSSEEKSTRPKKSKGNKSKSRNRKILESDHYDQREPRSSERTRTKSSRYEDEMDNLEEPRFSRRIQHNPNRSMNINEDEMDNLEEPQFSRRIQHNPNRSMNINEDEMDNLEESRFSRHIQHNPNRSMNTNDEHDELDEDEEDDEPYEDTIADKDVVDYNMEIDSDIINEMDDYDI
jgi:hypothetical protein